MRTMSYDEFIALPIGTIYRRVAENTGDIPGRKITVAMVKEHRRVGVALDGVHPDVIGPTADRFQVYEAEELARLRAIVDRAMANLGSDTHG